MKKLAILSLFIFSLTTVHAFDWGDTINAAKSKFQKHTGGTICNACGVTSYVSEQNECLNKSNECGLGWINGCVDPSKDFGNCCEKNATGDDCRSKISAMINSNSKLKKNGIRVKTLKWTDQNKNERKTLVMDNKFAESNIVRCNTTRQECMLNELNCSLCKRTLVERNGGKQFRLTPVDIDSAKPSDRESDELFVTSTVKAERQIASSKKKIASAKARCKTKGDGYTWTPGFTTDDGCVKKENAGREGEKDLENCKARGRIGKIRNGKCDTTGSQEVAAKKAVKTPGNPCEKQDLNKKQRKTLGCKTNELTPESEQYTSLKCSSSTKKKEKKIEFKDKPCTNKQKLNNTKKFVVGEGYVKNKNKKKSTKVLSKDPTLDERKKKCENNGQTWFAYKIILNPEDLPPSKNKVEKTTIDNGICCPQRVTENNANEFDEKLGLVLSDMTRLTSANSQEVNSNVEIKDWLTPQPNCKCFKVHYDIPYDYKLSGGLAVCSDNAMLAEDKAPKERSIGNLRKILNDKKIKTLSNIGTSEKFKICQGYWGKGWQADQKRANHYNLKAEKRWVRYWEELTEFTQAAANDGLDGNGNFNYASAKETESDAKTWESCPKSHTQLNNYRAAKINYLNTLRTEPVNLNNMKQNQISALQNYSLALKAVKVKLRSCASELYKKMNECASFHVLTAFSSGVQAARASQTVDVKTKQVGTNYVKDTKSSMDNIIKCQTEGKETQDWQKCLAMINTYHTMSTINKGAEVIHAAQVTSSMANATTSMQNVDAKERQVKQLEILKTQALDSKRMAYERMASQTATTYMYSSAVKNMPSLGDALRYCNALENESTLGLTSYLAFIKKLDEAFPNNQAYTIINPKPKTFNYKINLGQKEIAKGEEEKEDGPRLSPSNPYPKQVDSIVKHNKITPEIEHVKGYESDFSYCDENTSGDELILLPNSRAGDGLKAKAVQAGLAAFKEYMAAEAFQNKANLLDRAMDRINNILNKDITTADELIANDLENMAICQADPTDPACVRIDTTRAMGFSGSGGFNMNGTSGNTTFSNMNDKDENADKSNETLPNPNSITPDGILANDHSGKSIIDTGDRAPGAAGIKMGGGKGGGPGGSGATSAPGAPGGPSGGAADSGARGSSGGVPGADRIGFSEGGVDSYSGGGGKRRRSRGNPFSKLFKKGRYGKNMKFGRNPASIGGKNGKSIFEKISNRYTSVTSKKRLLEYEIQK